MLFASSPPPPPARRAGQEGLGTSIQALSAILYANDGLVTSPERAFFQGVCDALTGLLDQVGLRTNKGKMVSMY